MKLPLPELKCAKCGHEWTPRVPNPQKCPSCGYPKFSLKPKEEATSDE